MKSNIKILIIFLVINCQLSTVNYAQVGINTDGSNPDASAIMDIKSTTKGMLVPRMTTTQRTSISSPATGLLVFDTTTESFWFKTSATWLELKGASIATSLQDADNDTKIQVEESPDEDKIRFDIGGNERFVFEETNGSAQLKMLNTGKRNIFIGDGNIADNNTGSANTVVGSNSFSNNAAGTSNTGIGQLVFASNVTGNFNAAIGQATLLSNTSGEKNTALGAASLLNNQTGNNNVAVGYNAGFSYGASGSIFLGFEAGHNETNANRLYIENSSGDSSNALIYGEFDNNRLKVNGHLSITDGFADADNDTKIQVEESPNEDKIRFDIGGNERFVFEETNGSAQLKMLNTGKRNIFIGDGNIGDNNTGSANTVVGSNSFSNNTAGTYNTGIGQLVFASNVTGNFNAAIGQATLLSNTTGEKNTALGAASLLNNQTGNNNVAVGYNAGFSYDASGSIFLGYEAGHNETNANRLYIENSSGDSSNALIYGEFDNNRLKVNGHLSITDGFADADNDTKIQVEESADEDIIRFDLEGTELLRLTKNSNGVAQIEVLNNNTDLFIGEGAGASQNKAIAPTAFFNTGVGDKALTANTSGSFNTALGASSLENNLGTANVGIGSRAGLNNQSGSYNTFIGHEAGSAFGAHDKSRNVMVGAEAGRFNKGDGNLFLGHQAGYSETGDNKLYITNSLTTSPLIYGEFDNALLRVNGTLNVNNAFSFPTVDGTNGQVLKTDGSGTLSWANASSVTFIEDADNDTKIQVEESPDEDKIRFDIDGTEKMNIDNSKVNVSTNLDISGDVTIGADDDYPVRNNHNMKMLSGKVNSSGSLTSTSNPEITTISRTSTGIYNIVFATGAFISTPIVTVTAIDASGIRTATITSISTTGFTVKFNNSGGSLKDTDFNFILIGEN